MRTHGFTLIETAIILIIASLVISSLLVPLSVQFDMSQMENTQKRLAGVKRSLINYYAVHYGRLPCPDIDVPADGLENRNNDMSCGAVAGSLPWRNLNINKAIDAWGNLLGYRVSQYYIGLSPPPPASPTTASLRIQLVDPQYLDPNNPVIPNIENINNDNPLAAIVFSQGRNGTNDHQCVPDPLAAAIAPADCYAVYAYIAKEEDMGTDIRVTDDIFTWLSVTELSRYASIGQQQDNDFAQPPIDAFTPVGYEELSR